MKKNDRGLVLFKYRNNVRHLQDNDKCKAFVFEVSAVYHSGGYTILSTFFYKRNH